MVWDEINQKGGMKAGKKKSTWQQSPWIYADIYSSLRGIFKGVGRWAFWNNESGHWQCDRRRCWQSKRHVEHTNSQMLCNQGSTSKLEKRFCDNFNIVICMKRGLNGLLDITRRTYVETVNDINGIRNWNGLKNNFGFYSLTYFLNH